MNEWCSTVAFPTHLRSFLAPHLVRPHLARHPRGGARGTRLRPGRLHHHEARVSHRARDGQVRMEALALLMVVPTNIPILGCYLQGVPFSPGSPLLSARPRRRPSSRLARSLLRPRLRLLRRGCRAGLLRHRGGPHVLRWSGLPYDSRWGCAGTWYNLGRNLCSTWSIYPGLLCALKDYPVVNCFLETVWNIGQEQNRGDQTDGKAEREEEKTASTAMEYSVYLKR